MDRKKMAFSGTWYPATDKACELSIKQFLSEKQGRMTGKFVGGIVPHAGWYYSGSIACRVIASLAASGKDVDTILLFGGHMHRQSGPFILASGAFETPFGDIEADRELVEKIASGLDVRMWSPKRFPDENTFELQLPFIKYFFPDAKIVACAVPPSFYTSIVSKTAVGEAGVLGRSICVIGSTDMTHYGPGFGLVKAGSGKAAVDWVKNENDRRAIDAMTDMDDSKIIAQGLENKNMCCPGAAAATVVACKAMGAVKAVELDYATSHDKSGTDDSFVGYSGILYALS